MALSQYWSNHQFPELELNSYAVETHRADKASLETEVGQANAFADSNTLTVTVDALTTADTTPELTGTLNDPNATIALTVDGQNHVPVNNGDGTWTLADGEIAPALGSGTYSVSVTITSPDGNTGSTPGTDKLVIS